MSQCRKASKWQKQDLNPVCPTPESLFVTTKHSASGRWALQGFQRYLIPNLLLFLPCERIINDLIIKTNYEHPFCTRHCAKLWEYKAAWDWAPTSWNLQSSAGVDKLFCKDSKYSGLYGPYGLCHKHSKHFVPAKCETTTDICKEWAWLCSNKILLNSCNFHMSQNLILYILKNDLRM